MRKEIDLRKFDGKAESTNICRYLGRDYETISTWDQLIPMMQKIGDDFIGLDGGDTFCDADLMYEHDMHCLLHKDVHYVRNKVSELVDYINKQMGREASGTLYRLTLENLYDFKDLKEAFHGGQLIDIRLNTLVWMDGTVVWCIRDVSAANKGQDFSAEMNGDTYYAGSIDEIIIKLYAECGDTVSKVKYKYKH